MTAIDSKGRDQSNDDSLRVADIQALDLALHTSAGLRVGVQDGIVHLAGRLQSLELWESAEVVAAYVPGVRGVVNRIEAPGAPGAGRTVHLDLNSESKGGLL